MFVSKKFWIAGTISAVVVGLAGGISGAMLSASPPALVSSTTSVAPGPTSIKPGTPILLFNKGAARAEVKVDRNGLILLNFTTKTGHNQIALGVLGDSTLRLGVFNSAGVAKAGLEVPMKDSAKVRMLLFNTRPQPSASRKKGA